MNLRDLYRASPHAAADKRQILKEAIRGANKLGIFTGMDNAVVNTARLDDLIQAAEALPESIGALLADRLAEPVQAEADSAEPVQAEADSAEPEPEPEADSAEPEADSAEPELARQIRGLLSGDLASLPARIAQTADSVRDALLQAAAAAQTAPAVQAGPEHAGLPTVTPAGTCTVQSITGAKDLRTVTRVRTLGGNVPSIDPDYAWPADSGEAMRALERGQHVMLSGPRGTGKSSWALQFAAETGRHLCRVVLSAQTQLPDLLGSTHLADGATYWRAGPLVEALQTPYAVILLDEPSLAPAEVVSGLNGLLDGHGITLPDGRHVLPAHGVVFILADNTNGTGDSSGLYAGTGTMNRAFLDRCAIQVPIGYLDSTAEADMLQRRSGAGAPVCAALVSFARITRDAAEAGTLAEGIGPRRLVAMATMLADGSPAGTALRLAVLSGLDETDRLAMDQIAAASWPDDHAWQVLAGTAAPRAEAPRSTDPKQQQAREEFAAAGTEI